MFLENPLVWNLYVTEGGKTIPEGGKHCQRENMPFWGKVMHFLKEILGANPFAFFLASSLVASFILFEESRVT